MAKSNLDKLISGFFGKASPSISEFKKVNNAHAVNSEGFEVKFNRHSVTYNDSEVTCSFEVEHGTGDLSIYRNEFNIHNNLSGRKLEEIKKLSLMKISDALSFLGVNHQID